MQPNTHHYNILCVDDKTENLFALEMLLARLPGVHLVKATSGNEALLRSLEYELCLAIVDVQMPEMTGYELVELLRGAPRTAQLPVIFISAIYSDDYHHRLGYGIGAVDFLSKPFIPEILLSKVKVFIELYEQRLRLHDWAQTLENRVAERTEDLEQAYDATLEGWSKALELRERETAGHSRRVVDLTMGMARRLKVSDDDLVTIHRGALLHDIGKMGIPDSILLKPGPLTSEEWKIMRMHPVYAFDLLNGIEYLRPAMDIPYCHHERWDGGGYPRGLQGEAIPLAARIFAIVDVWDALISDRPYRMAMPPQAALNYIQSCAGSHFDPRLVDIFARMLREQGLVASEGA